MQREFLWVLLGALQVVVLRVSSSPVQQRAQLQEEKFVCPSNDGNFPIPGQCSSEYYMCIAGVPHEMTCPGGAIFDPSTSKCTKPENASCRTTTAPSITELPPVEVTTMEEPFICPNDGNFPIPGQCSSSYYMCINGIIYEMVCPGGNIFDPVTWKCTSPNSASCRRTTVRPTESSSATSEPSVETQAPTDLPTQEHTDVSTEGPVETQAPTDHTTQEHTKVSSDGPVETQAPTDYTTQGHTEVSTEGPVETQAPTDYTTQGHTEVSSQGPVETQGPTEQTAPTEEPSTEPFKCTSDGFYPISSDCSPHFYICMSGVAYIMTCPANGLFDPVTLRCATPDVATCRTTERPETTTLAQDTTIRTDPTTAIFEETETPTAGLETSKVPIDTESPTEAFTTEGTGDGSTVAPFVCPTDGHYAIPGQCTGSYYICIDLVPHLMTCPGNAIFDPLTMKCTTTNLASCRATTTEAPRTTNVPVVTDVPSTQSPVVSSEKPTETDAPVTTEYSPSSTGISVSVPEGTEAPGTEVPLSTETPFICPKPDGHFPVPGQCTSLYYICISSIPYLANCPGGAIFDPITLKCTTSSSASCTGTTPVVSVTSSPAGFVCPQPNGNFQNPESCQSFYMCANNVPHLTTCGAGTVFNQQTEACDWPFNVPGCQSQELDTFSAGKRLATRRNFWNL